MKEPNKYNIKIVGEPNGFTFEEQRYPKYGEFDVFTSKQIAVTYTCDGVWDGPIPEGEADKMQKFIDKLENKQPTKVLFYGDSITTGCNASGITSGGTIPPYTPPFTYMVVDYLSKRYDCMIEYENTAKGGTSSIWGLANVQERVVEHDPDLVVIGFGMNDGSNSVEDYKKNMEGMIKSIYSANPDCCIVVIATTVPNNETDLYRNQEKFVDVLYEIENDMQYVHLAIADMTSMHLALLKNKKFGDMTGNNFNHPNDFLIRVQAQVILKTLLGEAFVPIRNS